MYDIIIVGGGPAGLTAAVYARRANRSVLVIEKDSFGGQITFSPNVENIPGFEAVSGNEFAEKLVGQALEQGADMESAEVTGIVRGENGVFTVLTDGDAWLSGSVILASGAKHRTLGLEGEEELIGNGISFCAVCDGAFYRGRQVAVVGGGNSALQETLLLADLCEKVTVIQNLPFLTGEKKLADAVAAKPNVEVITSAVVDAYLGTPDTGVTGVRIKKDGGELIELPAAAVFLAVGLVPQNEAFADLVALDERGYADSGENCLTKTPGLFVAGDCRAKRIRQVTTAAADGAVAALAACDYLGE